jgi:hypothetical protein
VSVQVSEFVLKGHSFRGHGKLDVAFALGWRSGSPLRLLHCFEYGFSR